MPTFEGRTVLVIGGSSGMGRGAARAVAARGGDVVVTSRSPERVGDAVAAVLRDLAPADGAAALGRVRGAACDLTDLDGVRAAVADVGVVDHLVVTAAPARGVTDREFFDGKFWGTQARPSPPRRRR